MARSGFRDPLDKYRWVVDIPGFSKSGFLTCSVPKSIITTRKYREAGAHLNPKLIYDQVEYAPVTLSRGVTNDTSFTKWATSAWDLVQKNAGVATSDSGDTTSPTGMLLAAASSGGAKPVPSESGYPFSYRRTVKIENVNRAGQTEVVYVLYNAIPTIYHPASDFDALDDNTVSIETLTIEYEGFDILYTGLAGTTANIITGQFF